MTFFLLASVAIFLPALVTIAFQYGNAVTHVELLNAAYHFKSLRVNGRATTLRKQHNTGRTQR